ncbi:hypothetical protein ACFYWU_30145, partial [Streptomyces chrestomyceticus]|uniref:hypothetical protein n=1 Tax=Streptomyces chrestomyceticus TaxID=68185 RepID=UPI003693FE7B
GRFLCACFTRLSGRFPSVLRFRLYQILAVLIFAGAFRPFGFFAVPTLPDPFGVSAFRFRPLLERVFFAPSGVFTTLAVFPGDS